MKITKGQKEMNAIINKCWEDENFKQQLIANPIQTIEDFKGSTLNIPNGFNLVVADQTDSSNVYFNIPAKPNLDDVELTEDQLEAVSGGNIVEYYAERLLAWWEENTDYGNGNN